MARPRTVSAPLLAASASLDITSVAANTTAEIEFTVAGARPGHPVIAWVEDTTNPLDVGLALVAAWSTALNKIKMRFMNTTAGALVPGVTVFKIVQL